MAKSNWLITWFKKNVLRMGDGTQESPVDLSREEEIAPSMEELLLEEGEDPSAFQKPKTVKMVNSNLTVVSSDGKVYSKGNATVADYEKVKNATSQKEIDEVFHSAAKAEEVIKEKEEKRQVIQKKEEIKKIISNFDILSSYQNLFVVVDNTVYLNKDGMQHRSIPQLLIKKFTTVVKGINESTGTVKDEYEKSLASLVRFWEKCCLCPNAQSAEDLYGFLDRHKFKIDEHGNFYTYRRVIRLDNNASKADKDLVDFVSNVYNKVKAVWKKKPVNFDVYKNGKEFKLIDLKKVTGEIKAEKVGNLEELYTNSLRSMPGNRFTDNHTKKEDYRVGEIISMPRNQGDDSNKSSCSKGYHVASKAYDYSSFGNTPILAIVNPIDVLSVPVGEIGKMRVCRWFFAMTLDPKEEHILDDDRFDVRQLGDVFENKCLENLPEHVEKIYAEELKRHRVNLPEMSKEQIKATVKSLEDIKNELRDRIQKAV